MPGVARSSRLTCRRRVGVNLRVVGPSSGRSRDVAWHGCDADRAGTALAGCQREACPQAVNGRVRTGPEPA